MRRSSELYRSTRRRDPAYPTFSTAVRWERIASGCACSRRSHERDGGAGNHQTERSLVFSVAALGMDDVVGAGTRRQGSEPPYGADCDHVPTFLHHDSFIRASSIEDEKGKYGLGESHRERLGQVFHRWRCRTGARSIGDDVGDQQVAGLERSDLESADSCHQRSSCFVDAEGTYHAVADVIVGDRTGWRSFVVGG